MKVYFSVEKSAGEDENAIHLYFGNHVRIEIGKSVDSLRGLILQLEKILGEVEEGHAHELGE